MNGLIGLSREYWFGEFRLAAATRELRRGDELLVLAPKVFECLNWLIEHRDRAVGRDELIAAVWEQIDVPDNLLAQIIARLRRMIDVDGDAGESAIRTIPRFGYRWVAPTEVHVFAPAEAVLAVVPIAGELDPARAPSRRRWSVPLLAGLTVLCTASIGLWQLRDADHAVGVSKPVAAGLAMLLPVSVDDAPEHAWMRLGLMALVGERLQAAGQRMVPSENATALALGFADGANGHIDIDALLHAAPAALVMSARTQKIDGRWRVELQTLRGREPSLESVGEADDAIDAARESADRMARQLGLVAQLPAASAVGEPELSRLLVKVEAATLAGDIGKAIVLIDGATEAQRQSPDLRYRRAWTAFAAGQLDVAQTEYLGLLEELSAEKAPVMRARVLNGLANVQYERRDIAGLRRSSEEAVAILEGRDAGAELGRALMGRAVANSRLDDPEAARRDFAQARIVLESAGDRLGVARAELAAGVFDKQRGRLFEALPALESAASQLAAFHDVHDELLARTHIAHARLLLLEPAAALAVEARLGILAGQAHSVRARALAELTRIEVLIANGRLSAAKSLFAGLCGAGQVGDLCAAWPLQMASVRRALEDGNSPATRRALDAALAHLPIDEDGRDPGRAWLTLLRDHIERGRGDDARGVLAAVNAWAGSRETPETRLYALLVNAEQHAAAGRNEAAQMAFEAADRHAEALRVPADILWAAQAYAAWLIRRDDPAAAGIVAARSAGWARTDYDAALLQLRIRHALGQSGAWAVALERAQALAGERSIPAELAIAPSRAGFARPAQADSARIAIASPQE